MFSENRADSFTNFLSDFQETLRNTSPEFALMMCICGDVISSYLPLKIG